MEKNLYHSIFKRIIGRDFNKDDKNTLVAVAYLFRKTGLDTSDYDFQLDSDGFTTSDYFDNNFENMLGDCEASYLGTVADSVLESLKRLADRCEILRIPREEWVELCAKEKYKLSEFKKEIYDWRELEALNTVCSCEAYRWY